MSTNLNHYNSRNMETFLEQLSSLLLTVNEKSYSVFSSSRILLFMLFLSGSLFAQVADSTIVSESESTGKKITNAVNMCPVAIAFRFYSANFEHLFNQTHGLVGRFDYESISDSYSGNPIELSGFGFTVNYRYHLSEQMESIYLGSYLRYRYYDGNGTAESTKFDFSITEVSWGVNIGKRWVWDSGFNVLFSLGYGISSTSRDTSPTNDSIESTINAFEDEYTFFGPFLGELSIGYAF